MSERFAPPKVTIRRHLASQICDRNPERHEALAFGRRRCASGLVSGIEYGAIQKGADPDQSGKPISGVFEDVLGEEGSDPSFVLTAGINGSDDTLPAPL
jgi:hypothetical protein